MLNIPPRSYFLKSCHWTHIEGCAISIFLCFTEILLPCSCDYFYLVMAKIKIIHFWICLQAGDNCQHAPEYILQIRLFFLKYFQDFFFQVKKVIIMAVNEWWWFLRQFDLPVGELCSSWNEARKSWPCSHCLFVHPECTNLWLWGLFSCNTTTMKCEVLNPSCSSTFLPVSLVFFSAHFIQINKQAKSDIFGSNTLTYRVECCKIL